MTLNLHLLRIFFVVARERSFSRAAEKLFISQPAVSKAVLQLEGQLALPLLERPGKGRREVRLTEGGEALFEHARGIFALERAAVEEVLARARERRGRLVLGASTTIAGYWLAPYLATMLRNAPEIGLQVRVGNTAAIERAIVDCEIDIALVEGPVFDERIEVVHWRDDPMCLAASASSPLARRGRVDAELLSEQTWLMRETGSGTREVAERFMSAHEIEPARTIEIWSNESISRSVAAGVGVALLPVCVVRELQAVRAVAPLRFFPTTPLSRPLYRVGLRERPKSPLLKRFCETLAEPA
jgi:DNA-binding transcriptional LysR family regulator